MTPVQRNLLCYVATSGGHVSAERLRALFGWHSDFPIRVHVEELRHELRDQLSIRFTRGRVLLGAADGTVREPPALARLPRIYGRPRRGGQIPAQADPAVRFILERVRSMTSYALVEQYAGIGQGVIRRWRYRASGDVSIRSARRVLNAMGWDLAIVPRAEDEGRIDLSEMDARRARRLEEDDGRVIARVQKLKELVGS